MPGPSYAHAADVAKYILATTGPMPAMKLQKLVYYTQAWSWVWDDRPLFLERIEAWTNGPVVPALWQQAQYQYIVGAEDIVGDVARLDQDAKDTIVGVLEFYGKKTAQELSDLTHVEAPWRIARGSLPSSARGNARITDDSIRRYYTSLAQRQQTG
jgi:uncharacterized phage-associated protein